MPAIIVHGGAGRQSDSKVDSELGRREGLERSAEAGAQVMRSGGSALDAVIAAIEVLEDDPAFNAGTGGVLTTEGNVEMDAALMTSDRRCGGVAGLVRVQHAIAVARAVMEQTDHALLVGDGALRFARAAGFPDYDPVHPIRRERWEAVRAKVAAGDPGAFEQKEMRFWKRLSGLAAEYLPLPDQTKRGTVGACAVDASGATAAGTSTGGIWFKLPGRVGDTPLYGAGTWATEHGAASATGHGEGIIRLGLTRTAVDAMASQSVGEAVEVAIAQARDLEVECGIVAVDAQGRAGAAKNAEYMGTAQAVW